MKPKAANKYDGMTREQLEMELDHRQEMIDQLGQALGQVQIQNVSMSVQLKKAQAVNQQQEQQMMQLVEKG